MITTHSIIITFTDDTAVVWYPDAPVAHWHLITDGVIHENPWTIPPNEPMSATEFLETYAEGTD